MSPSVIYDAMLVLTGQLSLQLLILKSNFQAQAHYKFIYFEKTLKAVFEMVYRTTNLKNGKTVALDWLKEDDLLEVAEALNSVIREGKYLLINEEITDMEEERRWFERSKKEGMLYLVARTGGKVVGGASIHPQKQKRAHVAEYGIFICKDYRNQGLGTELTKTFAEIAKKHGIEILQLSVYATNKKAFNVYKKCGYKECGRFTGDIKFSDGTYTDRILMELHLK